MQLSKLSSALIRSLAEERRRIVSFWRAWVLCRRIALSHQEPLPDAAKVERILQERNGFVRFSGEGLKDIYLVDIPYASLVEISEDLIAQECDPWMAFSHLTALAYHHFTDVISSTIYATYLKGGADHRVPLGTTPEDWVDLDHPTPSDYPKRINQVEVVWTEVKSEWNFGFVVGLSAGAAIYMTDPEAHAAGCFASARQVRGDCERFPGLEASGRGEPGSAGRLHGSL